MAMALSSHHNSEANNVKLRLEEFIQYFVEEFETRLLSYHLCLKGLVKKPGKTTSTVSGKGGAIAGGVIGGALGYFAGNTKAGVKSGAKFGGKGVEWAANKFGNEHHTEKVEVLNYFIDESQKNKKTFRRLLVKIGYDLFQSFEMQFVRLTKNKSPEYAMHVLAKDAVKRAIDYLKNNSEMVSLTAKCCLLGKSKRDGIAVSPGYEVIYRHLSTTATWNTADLYDKSGIFAEDSWKYWKKEDVSDTSHYGYRRVLEAEYWSIMKSDYLEDKNLVNSKQFTDYQYILNSKISENEITKYLDVINGKDEKLLEDRVKEVIKDVQQELISELNILKSHLGGEHIEIREMLENIEEILANLNLNNLFQEFAEYVKEAKQERLEILKGLKYGRKENLQMFTNATNERKEILEAVTVDSERTIVELQKANLGIENISAGQENILKRMNEISAKKQVKKSIWYPFHMIEPVAKFTGRKTETEDLHTALQTSKGRAVISQSASITGLGGIGKTELARVYAFSYKKFYSNNVIWIDAETNESLAQCFTELLEEVQNNSNRDGNVSKKKIMDIKIAVKKVYEYFFDLKSLFIFDNADNFNSIKDFLPPTKHPNREIIPTILITSRNRNWSFGLDGEITVIPLVEFTPEEAVEFIKETLESSKQDEDMNELAETLQYLPLALKQAVAFINNQNETFKIRNYLQEYQQQTQSLLEAGYNENDYRYNKSVFTTWITTVVKISKDKVYGKLATDILNKMSYISPDRIPDKLFCPTGVNEDFKGAIKLLHQYSMINREFDFSIIHRLVQQVTRISLEHKRMEEIILGKVLKMIKSSKDETHITSAWNYACKYEELIDAFYSDTNYIENKSTPLHLLSASGNLKAVEKLLQYKKKLQIDSEDIYGRTPLYRAVEKGHLNIVKCLFDNGANINANNATASTWFSLHWTPLHVATYEGHKDIVEFLIVKDAKIEAQDSSKRTPLYVAICEGHKDIALLLDGNRENTLVIASSLGDLKLAKEILVGKSVEDKRRMCNPKVPGKRGSLHFAANSGFVDVVEYLIQNGADILNSANDGFTPLHMASSSGHLGVVKFLARKLIERPDFDILRIDDPSGWTVLHSAAKTGQRNVLKFLLKEFSRSQSADKPIIEASDSKGTTLLQTAAFHGNIETVKFLVESRANINAIDIFGATPLFAASIQNHTEVAKYLLAQPGTSLYSDPSKVLGMLDITPLHGAAVYDNVEIAEAIVKKAKERVHTKLDTWIDEIRTSGNPVSDLMKLKALPSFENLLVNTLTVNAGEKYSLNPIQGAAFFNSPKVIEFLLQNGANIDTGVNFLYVVHVLNYVLENDLKDGFGSQFIGHLRTFFTIFIKIPFLANYLGSLFTPRVWSTAFEYDNCLVKRNVSGDPIHTFWSWTLSLLFSIPKVEKQWRMIRDYVESMKTGQNAPSPGEASIFFDITNIPQYTE